MSDWAGAASPWDETVMPAPEPPSESAVMSEEKEPSLADLVIKLAHSQADMANLKIRVDEQEAQLLQAMTDRFIPQMAWATNDQGERLIIATDIDIPLLVINRELQETVSGDPEATRFVVNGVFPGQNDHVLETSRHIPDYMEAVNRMLASGDTSDPTQSSDINNEGSSEIQTDRGERQTEANPTEIHETIQNPPNEGDKESTPTANPSTDDQEESAANNAKSKMKLENFIPCGICEDNLDISSIVYVNCGHVFCRECLNHCFRVGLSSKADFPPRCCIPEGIDISAVDHFLDEDLVIRYTLVAEEYATRQPTFCANKPCSRFLDANKIGKAVGKFVVCNECESETCIECKQGREVHPEDSEDCPEVISKEDKELAEGQKWKQCPGCKNLVERQDGCNHMVCECGTEFCYECGEQKKEDNSCGCVTVADEDGWHDRLNQEEMQANGLLTVDDFAPGEGDDEDEDDGDGGDEHHPMIFPIDNDNAMDTHSEEGEEDTETPQAVFQDGVQRGGFQHGGLLRGGGGSRRGGVRGGGHGFEAVTRALAEFGAEEAANEAAFRRVVARVEHARNHGPGPDSPGWVIGQAPSDRHVMPGGRSPGEELGME